MMTKAAWRKLFGNEVKLRMKEKGTTQSELADEAGISRTALNLYLNGKRTPSIKAIINISSALGITCDEICMFGERIDLKTR